jgi:hypothetical protein
VGLYSYVIHHRPVPGFTPPYAIAVVELDEGPRMITHIATAGETPVTITHYLGITPKWIDGTAVGGASPPSPGRWAPRYLGLSWCGQHVRRLGHDHHDKRAALKAAAAQTTEPIADPRILPEPKTPPKPMTGETDDTIGSRKPLFSTCPHRR